LAGAGLGRISKNGRIPDLPDPKSLLVGSLVCLFSYYTPYDFLKTALYDGSATMTAIISSLVGLKDGLRIQLVKKPITAI